MKKLVKDRVYLITATGFPHPVFMVRNTVKLRYINETIEKGIARLNFKTLGIGNTIAIFPIELCHMGVVYDLYENVKYKLGQR